jgi:uncharacterized C2H2 Zn-finger protein
VSDEPTGFEEYGRIDISLRLGGPPRVVIEGKQLTNDDLHDAARFLEDLTRTYRGGDLGPWEYARLQWQKRRDAQLRRGLEVAEQEVKRATYEQARPLRCIGCRRRFKHQDSLAQHIAREHTIHWRGKRGKTLCGTEEYLVTTTVPGKELHYRTICAACETAHEALVGDEIDALLTQQETP